MAVEFRSVFSLLAAVRRLSALWMASLALVFSGCDQGLLDNQPRYDPLEPSDFFADQMSARPLVEGTVARGKLRLDDHAYTGMVDGEYVTEFPFEIGAEELARGRERFNIYCAPCHDMVGTGHGMIVQRGFPQPPSYHIDRLREAPVGHFFDVITGGFGVMPDYAVEVAPYDRWLIIAYIRTLQLSQHFNAAALPENDRRYLEEAAEQVRIQREAPEEHDATGPAGEEGDEVQIR